MRAVLAGLSAGIVFGIGLMLGGMTQPAKVIAFLDVAGDWDPSLAFVMGGAILIYAPAYRLLAKHTMTSDARAFLAAASNEVDSRLVFGAILFGAGWGLAGFCPGPGFVALGTLKVEGLVFGASMLAGMGFFRLFDARNASIQR